MWWLRQWDIPLFLSSQICFPHRSFLTFLSTSKKKVKEEIYSSQKQYNTFRRLITLLRSQTKNVESCMWTKVKLRHIKIGRIRTTQKELNLMLNWNMSVNLPFTVRHKHLSLTVATLPIKGHSKVVNLLTMLSFLKPYPRFFVVWKQFVSNKLDLYGGKIFFTTKQTLGV